MKIRRKTFISICKKLIKKIDEDIKIYESEKIQSDTGAIMLEMCLKEMKTSRDILEHEYNLAKRSNDVYWEINKVIELIFNIYGVIKCDYDKV